MVETTFFKGWNGQFTWVNVGSPFYQPLTLSTFVHRVSNVGSRLITNPFTIIEIRLESNLNPIMNVCKQLIFGNQYIYSTFLKHTFTWLKIGWRKNVNIKTLDRSFIRHVFKHQKPTLLWQSIQPTVPGGQLQYAYPTYNNHVISSENVSRFGPITLFSLHFINKWYREL